MRFGRGWLLWLLWQRPAGHTSIKLLQTVHIEVVGRRRRRGVQRADAMAWLDDKATLTLSPFCA